MLALIALSVIVPKMELGVVMNIDLGSEATFKRHFEIAEGWASYIRVSTGMDLEGWKPEIGKLPLLRARRLAVECRSRGMGMDIHFGGMPDREMWSAIEEPGQGYSVSKYRTLPKSWWPKWAEYQRASAKATVDAYGPDATKRIRFQLFNEPYDRGEDDVADELMQYLVARICDRDGKVFGCPLDGPSLWGPPAKMERQIERFGRLMRSNPLLNKAIQKVPISMYPTPDEAGQVNADELVRQYVEEAKRTVSSAESQLGRPVYFSEAGVGRVYDIRPALFGARTNQLAERCLLKALSRFRDAGFNHVTIYQTKDTNERDASGYGYGLADWTGRLRVDVSQLAKLARGEAIEDARQPQPRTSFGVRSLPN